MAQQPMGISLLCCIDGMMLRRAMTIIPLVREGRLLLNRKERLALRAAKMTSSNWNRL